MAEMTSAQLTELTGCFVPEKLHVACAMVLERFVAGDTSVHTPGYVCNMVDSKLIPMVECLVDLHANGVLLNPYY